MFRTIEVAPVHRRTPLTALSAGIIGLTLVATTAAASTTGPARPGNDPVLRGHAMIGAGAGAGAGDPIAPHARARTNAKTSSLNWSGYAVPTGGVTEVRSQFVVPKVKAASAGFASTWTGIGGYGTSDLIQAGVAEEAGGRYYAWYEILPDYAREITGCNTSGRPVACSVRPGDVTYVRITLKSRNLWTVLIVNEGHGVRWGWVKDIAYASSQSSAEWVLEAPTVGAQTLLANVGTVRFGPISTYTVGSTQRTIAQGNEVKILMGQYPAREATPSALGRDGQSFNVCAYRYRCPSP